MIEWHKPTRARMASDRYIAIGAQRSVGHDSVQLVLHFSASACKDLRLIAGDRVLIGFDGSTKEVCFKRVTDTSGYKLSGKSSKSLTVSATIKGLTFFSRTPVDKPDVKQDGTCVSILFPKVFDAIKDKHGQP